jgi:pimeloyl-ACP methyl ester carboxylesterase
MNTIKKYIAFIMLMYVVIACTKQNSESSERFMFRHEGADLSVQVDGNVSSKVFILLLHGGPGGGGNEYNQGYYSDKLEEKYAMVYLDQRGNGSSQGNYDKSDLTLEQNSRDVYALTLYLKEKYGKDISLFLMGHSWGGTTSAHALLNTEIQKELKGWIEVDGAHDFNLNDVEGVKMFQEISEQQIALNKNTDFWQPIFDEVSKMDTNNVTSDNQGFLNSKGFEAEGKMEEITSSDLPNNGPNFGLLNSPDVSLSGYLSNQFGNPILNEDSQNNPMTSQLNQIEIPCQFLWGKYDFVVPPALGYSAFNLVNTTQKELVIFEHSGHSPMSNEPMLFVEEVIDFVELYK